jgi:ABC-type sugar transport system ATPase subunit
MSWIRVKGIEKNSERGPILRGVDLEQAAGERLVITGVSGSGKTTLMKIIAGLIQPDGGEVWIGEDRVKGPLEQLMPGHPGLVYLSQHFELPNNYRVEELLDFDDRLQPGEADQVYRLCRIDHLRQRVTQTLSGGEKQRVALARLLVKAPRILLIDEPFSNLDQLHKQQLKAVIEDLERKLGITILLVSHDPMDILPWARRIVVLRDGAVVQTGTTEDVYQHPADEYVAALLGSYNLLTPELAELFWIPSNGRAVILRPEQFQVQTGAPGIGGMVQGCSFLGYAYELVVEVQEQVVRVRHTTALPEGTRVTLTLRH